MKNTKLEKPYLYPDLVASISRYGREKLIETADVSKGMVDAVCAGRRRFGPEKAKEVAQVLKVDKVIVRPDLWA